MQNSYDNNDYIELTKTLRCVTCPNQSIADSTAPVAVSMRKEVLKQLSEQKSKGEIKAFFIEHYGESVVYEPPMGAQTVVLWFAPLVVVLIGLVAWLKLRDRT